VDDLVPKTFYILGLSFRGQITDGELSIIAHNARGAVQLSWPCGDDPAPADGQVAVHSPTSRPMVAQHFTEDCTVLGGSCYAEASAMAYTLGFRSLLLGGDMRLVCVELAAWHDECFAHRPVQP